MREQARRPVLIAVVILLCVERVTAAAVGYAIEVSYVILERAPVQISMQVDAEVPIGCDIRWESALDETCVHVLLQPFQTDWLLHFAHSQLGPRGKASRRISIHQNGLAVAEVRHDAKIVDLGNRAFDDGTYLAQQERVGANRIAQEESLVSLKDTAQSDFVATVGGSKGYPALADGRHHRRLLRFGRLLFLLNLLLAPEDAHLLIEVLYPLLESCRRWRRSCRRCRRRLLPEPLLEAL